MKKNTTKKEVYKYKLTNKQTKKKKIKTKAVDHCQQEKLVAGGQWYSPATTKVVASDYLKSLAKIIL
jgi:hypothetical protein